MTINDIHDSLVTQTFQQFQGLLSKGDSMNNELFTQFFNLLMELEPENLHMDGEASKAEVKRREKNIFLRWKYLEKAIGRSVSQDEVWQIKRGVTERK